MHVFLKKNIPNIQGILIEKSQVEFFLFSFEST